MEPVIETPPPAGAGASLTFNAPLSDDVVERLLTQVVTERTRTIADLGCGWGELLLRALERAQRASGTGIDLHQPDIARAIDAARSRRLADRVTFLAQDARDWRGQADLLLSVGAYQAFGDIPAALTALRNRTTPGGRLLFGCEYWAAPPMPEELRIMWGGTAESDCLYLPALVDAIHAAGWRVLALHDSTRAELDDFELGHLRDRQEWVLDHPDHPLGRELTDAVANWVHGHRRPLGFVTFVLA